MSPSIGIGSHLSSLVAVVLCTYPPVMTNVLPVPLLSEKTLSARYIYYLLSIIYLLLQS